MRKSRKKKDGMQPSLTVPRCDFAIEGLNGPNGHPVGFTENGDLVEWRPPSEEDPNGAPLLLFRNEDDFGKVLREFDDKVWWNRHKITCHEIECGEISMSEAQNPHFLKGKEAAKRIEQKYGEEDLGWDDYNWGVVSGILSALNWVVGLDWEVSLDT